MINRLLRLFTGTNIEWMPMFGLRDAWRGGYRLSDLRADALAGLVVGVIALPLSMALAIATGVPPQYGLYTAIIAGGAIALLGGSRVQVSGPTAAFVVILAPIVTQYGLGGLVTATVMAGVLQVLFGVARFGRLIEFIPYPVTTGFTAGIAVVIATLQIKDLLGLKLDRMPDHSVDRVFALVDAMPSMHWPDLVVGCVVLSVLIGWDRITRRVPAPLIALTIGTVLAIVLSRLIDGFSVATIASRFGTESIPHGIPQAPPHFDWPWLFAAPGERPFQLNLSTIQSLVPSAFAIAILGSTESLLSAVVADGMSGHRHNPNTELVAQGSGNLLAPFFGGFAATGAIARTAANIRFGARSPLAAIVHALFVLAAVMALAPLLGYLPMSALAAMLLRVAWNMSEAKHFVRSIRVSPRSDTLVLLTCFGLTVIFDMVIAVSVGVVLASLLFMRRMAEVSGTRLVTADHHLPERPLPPGVVVYEIAGPMFFGAAQRAMSALTTVSSGISTVILDLEAVSVLDATGLVNFESALERLARMKVDVILVGLQPQPRRVFERSGPLFERHQIRLCASMDQAIDLVVLDHQPAAPSET